MSHQVIERTGREAPNSNGYFIQNAHGATVAGPFGDRFEAWREADRLDGATSEPANAGYIASRAPANGEPIAVLVTRDDGGPWELPADESGGVCRCPVPAETTVHASRGAALAEARRRWRR